MPYSNVRKVASVSVASWEVEGEFLIDAYYPSINYFVVVEDDAGERWVHEHVFNDSAELVQDEESGDYFVGRSWNEGRDNAAKLAARVEAKGFINLKHWGFHEFFSLSLEQRFAEEAQHEDMHRRGCGHLSNGVFAGGHA